MPMWIEEIEVILQEVNVGLQGRKEEIELPKSVIEELLKSYSKATKELP